MNDTFVDDIKAARRGDLDAFGRLILAHQDRVRAFLGARLRDHHQVDDLSQECFIIAFNKLEQYRDDASFSAWLRSIAHNLLRNYWRQRKEQYVDIRDEILEDVQDVDTDFLQDHIQHLRDCMQQLPKRSQQLLHARYADEKSIADLCKHYETKHSAMTMNLHRIRHQIKKCIESKGLEA